MPIHVLKMRRAVVSLLLVMLAIAAFPSSGQAATGATTASAGAANSCKVTSCGQCGRTCTGFDKGGSCIAWSCNTCTVTSTTACSGTCPVTNCSLCGQSCTGGFDKSGTCNGWTCNRCTVTDPSCGRVCPAAIPALSDAFDVQCFARSTNARCPSEISQTACTALITNASRVGLLTADAVTWLKANGYCPILRPNATGIDGYCPAGCFAAETQILTALAEGGATGYRAVASVAADATVLTASDDAGLDHVALVSRSIERVVSGPEEPPLVVLSLSNGATLRVTSHHPMVLETGLVVEAAAIARGAGFLGVDGRRIAVTAVAREPATADVFNFQTSGTTQLSHVIVAEGVLVGDLKLQNELAFEQSSIELRR